MARFVSAHGSASDSFRRFSCSLTQPRSFFSFTIASRALCLFPLCTQRRLFIAFSALPLSVSLHHDLVFSPHCTSDSLVLPPLSANRFLFCLATSRGLAYFLFVAYPFILSASTRRFLGEPSALVFPSSSAASRLFFGFTLFARVCLLSLFHATVFLFRRHRFSPGLFAVLVLCVI